MKYIIYYIIILIQLFVSNFCKAQSVNVIINEIMADPEPTVGLPAVEYVELRNVGSGPVELKNMLFRDRSTQAVLSEYVLAKDKLVILCPMNAVEEFADTIPLIGLNPWPKLNNTDEDLELISASGATLDAVSYERSWYKNTSRDDGGYSLERIGAGDGCSESQYWRASLHKSGGTPGNENSFIVEDQLPPVLQKAFGENSRNISLHFNEGISSLSLPLLSLRFEPALRMDSLYIEDENVLKINLVDELKPRLNYQVWVRNAIDCKGNLNSQEQSTVLVLPEKPDSMDVVVNEVLFNPGNGGTDFIELYNRSKKNINIAQWKLGNYQDTVVNPKEIIDENYILSPNDFLVLTRNIQSVRANYPRSKGTLFIEMDLPALNNTSGTVVIIDDDGTLIDYMKYAESFHYSLLQDLNGVSLERLDAWGNSLDENNWMSAAETDNFATPGYQNSQGSAQMQSGLSVTIDPELIIPDNDGDRDYTKISYSFEHRGNIAHISIFDIEGNEIAVIANNTLLGLNGFFVWDGTDWRGRKADFGVYLIHFQLFRADGNRISWLGRVVVASHF